MNARSTFFCFNLERNEFSTGCERKPNILSIPVANLANGVIFDARVAEW